MINTFSNTGDQPVPGSICSRHIDSEVCSRLRSQLFYLWTFIARHDLWEEAIDFLDDYYQVHAPLDLFFSSDVPF